MRSINILLICSIFLISFSETALAQYGGPYNHPASYYGGGENTADVKNLPACKAVQSIKIPEANPQSKELKSCNAWDYFYGLNGQHIDYEKARLCALNTPNNPDEILNSYQILEMIYANGYGIKKDLKLGTKFACENKESANTISDLTSVTFSKENPFDLCNYSNDPNTMTVCNNKIPMEINKNTWELKIKDISKNWPAQTQQLLKKLQAADSDYIDAYIGAEVDMSVFEDRRSFDTIDELDRDFFEDFKQFVNNTYPSYSDQQFIQLDQKLNALYKKIMAMNEKSYDIGVTHEAMRKVERKWLRYRDAWVAFAIAHDPTVNPNRIKTWITEERVNDLQEYFDAHQEEHQ